MATLCASLPYGPASCSGSDMTKQQPQPQPQPIDDVILQGSVTRSALQSFLGALPTPWDWATTFDAPVDGAALNGPLPFTFRVDVSACLGDPGGDTGAAGAPDVSGPSSPSGPFSGEAYLLVFHTSNDANVLRVFTSSSSYTPSNVEWQRLVSASASSAGAAGAGGSAQISVTVSTGSFQNDQLTPTCGPFLGETITFTVE